jgi:hypothetical protein
VENEEKTNLERAAEAVSPAVKRLAAVAVEAWKMAEEMRCYLEALENEKLYGITQEEIDLEAEQRALMEAIERIRAIAEEADEEMPLLPERKIQRPPKRLGPVNKPNYRANRPPRRARSSCRVIKR